MKKYLWLLVGLAVSLPAVADMYKYRDKKGNWVYTDEPVKGAVKVTTEVSVVGDTPSAAKAPPDESAGAENDGQKSNDEKQKD
ncbi:MAG: DUF4124 domain-containing protein [Methylobacillus sp.]|jgi:hypothetical protein|nr:DUF4124 domain-containing protein [Methylobacillus sp.]